MTFKYWQNMGGGGNFLTSVILPPGVFICWCVSRQDGFNLKADDMGSQDANNNKNKNTANKNNN